MAKMNSNTQRSRKFRAKQKAAKRSRLDEYLTDFEKDKVKALLKKLRERT